MTIVPTHQQQRDRARDVLGEYSVHLVTTSLLEARDALDQKRFRIKGRARREELNKLSSVLAALEVHYVQLWRALGADMPELLKERLLLAKLASPRPMFDNPLVGWGAQIVRDAVLRESGDLPTPSQLAARAGLERIAAANGAPIEDVPLR